MAAIARSPTRRSGVLLHPTSLPSPWPFGDLGSAALGFLDWLVAAGQSLWQTLPLGPVGDGLSPYDGASTYAGNPQLISLQPLVDLGLLAPDTEQGVEQLAIPEARRRKEELLRKACREWAGQPANPSLGPLIAELEVIAQRDSNWLDDWCLFAALKGRFDGARWSRWPPPLRGRDPAALEEARQDLANEIEHHRLMQCLFTLQWQQLRTAAEERGLQLCGDLPFYVAADSCDVWCHPRLFQLDSEGRPTAVSGVPPDAYAEEGQLWGQPLYDWERHREEGFRWWIERIRHQLGRVHCLRLDHFRALSAHWEVPAEAESAAAGQWRPTPGDELLAALEQADLLQRESEWPSLVAEDLGVITDDVVALRERFELPGIRVLQFGFDVVDSEHAPHRLPRRCFVYTGTHDNDTTRGWFENAPEEIRQRALDYLGCDADQISRQLVRSVLASAAQTAVIPTQDLLELGPEARMNTPGTTAGNWRWQLEPEQLDEALAKRLRRLVELTGRFTPPAEPGSETDRRPRRAGR